ncbi:hypothetical protein Daus18300_014397 [Diaporthe australafricana]|uniref:Nuclear GTPase SLIP-GC n=1 Tax=Diaporthe australafricana TaxID=127596 RepID=A0ABR3VVD1_9PEZI
MQGLHERVKKLSRFQPISTRTVGFVGDSGVGKSSLLNSLLDRYGLARTTNNGAACTCVVTEYHYHGEDNFIIEVDQFTTEELQDQLGELLGCYKHFHSELQREGLGQDDRNDLSEKANIAIDTFRTIFRGNLEDEDWLLEEEEDAILEQLQLWLEVGSARELPARQVVATFERCCSLLMQLTSETPDSEVPATWPRIRKIKVYLKAHILSKGLVLVDLPGLRDLNSARRNITERYLLECHEIFAVCSIGRATTDVAVKSVFDLALEARLRHVGIVCTRSDDIDPEEIKNDWGVEHGRRIKKLKKLLIAVQRELQETEEELNTFSGLPFMEVETQQELRQVLNAKKNLEKYQKVKLFELKEYAVKTRNTYVTQKLTEKYHGQVAGDTLHVFCISNTMYWEKREEDKSVAEPFLNLSGIIAVRKHCNSMVTESQLRESRSFLDDDVPALLSEIELWVQSGAGSASAEEKQAVRRVLDKVERQLRKASQGLQSRVHPRAHDLTSRTSLARAVGPSMKAAFQDNIWEGRDILEWTQASTEACSEWSTWHHSSYAAFCRKWGNHTTQAVGYRNWNKEAMSAMAESLEGPWEDLQSESEDQQTQLKSLINNSWNEAISLLDSEWPISSDPPDEIFEVMACREHLLVAEAEDKFGIFDRRLSMLETDALTGINSSFFGTTMSKFYMEALNHGGSGSDRRRKGVVSRALSNETIFKDLMKEFKRRFELHANELQQEIVEVVSGHLDAVTGTLDLVREENVAEESERDPDFRRRVAEELARVREFMRT